MAGMSMRVRQTTEIPQNSKKLAEYTRLLEFMRQYDFVTGTIGGFHERFASQVGSEPANNVVRLIEDAKHQGRGVLLRAAPL